MPIPPGYASVSVEKICQPDFEELELDISGGDREKTLKDALHGIILWPKHYIIIIPENDGSLRDHLELGPSSSVPACEPLQSSLGPSSSLPARSPSPQEPYDNSGEASSSDHDDDIPPNSPQQPFATGSQAQSFRSMQPPKRKQKRPAKKMPEPKTYEETEGNVEKEVKDFFVKVKEKTGRAGGQKNEGRKERLKDFIDEKETTVENGL
jgi:hypothetical protein